MLGALIYLQQKQILHRDVKPDNILSDGANNFYLADFGLSKTESMSNSYVGSLEYTAPDIFRAGLQTTKVDVWSLGVVILDVLHLLPQCAFDTWDKMCKGDQAWFHLVIECAKERVPQIMPMLQIDHRRRCSAKHCLENIFDQDSKIRDMPMMPPGPLPFADQASHTQARATQQGTAHVTSSAEPEISLGRRQSQRQRDQLGHERLGKQSPPSQTGPMALAHLAKVTEGRRASQQGQKQTPPQAQQQDPPQAGQRVQEQAQPQTSQQAAKQRDQHPREAPARQSPRPLPHPAMSGLGLEEIRKIGQAHQRSCQRAERQALEQEGQNPPLQSPLSGSEGLAEIQAIGRAHRLANERAARRAIQQRKRQEAQPRAPQPREHYVSGMPGRPQTGQQRDQLLRGTERREEAQQLRAQAPGGNPTLLSPKSAAKTQASNVRNPQTQPQRSQDARPRRTSAGPKTPPLKPAAATPPKSSKAHPTSSADPPASLERLQCELQTEQDWVQSLREPPVRRRPAHLTSSADPPPASQEKVQSELQAEQGWQDGLRETAVPRNPSPQRGRQPRTTQRGSPRDVARPRWLI
jgi:Protein kinase domain